MKIMQLIVALAVGILLLTGLVAPLVNASASKELTYTNEGVNFALTADDENTHTIIVDSSTVPGVNVDGETIIVENLPGSYSIVMGEHTILRFDPTNGRVVVGGTYTSGSSSVFNDLRTADSEETLTITIAGSTLTAVNGETTTTVEDTWAYITKEGDYVYAVNPCVTSEDRIIGGGVTYSPFSSSTVICFDGTIEEITAGIYRSNPTATLNDYVVNTTAIKGDLVRIDSIVFNCTQDGNDKSATYTYFLAPKEVTYSNPDYIGNTYAALLTATVLLGFVALIAFAAFAVRGRMND